MYWPGDFTGAAGNGELTGADKLKTETLANPELRLERTPDSVMVLPPSLSSLTAHPHKGEVQLKAHTCRRNILSGLSSVNK